MTGFPCPYLVGEVELTQEREQHYRRAPPTIFVPEQPRGILIGKEDIPHIADCPPDPRYRESEERSLRVAGQDRCVVNRETGEIENIEVLFFSTRLLRSDLFELPVAAELHIVPAD